MVIGVHENECGYSIVKEQSPRCRGIFFCPRCRGTQHLDVRSTILREYYNIRLIPYMIDDEGQVLLNSVLNELYKELAKR